MLLQAHNLHVGYAVLAFTDSGRPASVVWAVPSEEETLLVKKYNPQETFPGGEASFGWQEQMGLVAYEPVASGQGGLKITAVDGTDQFGTVLYTFDPRIGTWQPAGETVEGSAGI